MTITNVPNLTRDAAAKRAATLHVDRYRVDLDLTDGEGQPSDIAFRSITTIEFDATEPGASTWIDAVASRVHRATLNGIELDLTGYTPRDGLRIPDLAAHNVLVVDAEMLYTNTGEGLHRFVDPTSGDVYLYSQFETADAKRVYACFDQPDLKAAFTFSVVAPADWQVISNGRQVSSTPAGRAQLITFATTERMSTYITAIVAGPYSVVEDHHDGIDLRLLCRPELVAHLDAEDFLTVTKQGFDWYHENFGVRYPFNKYDQIFVPEFNAGAMENAACVTYREDDIFRGKVTDTQYERRGMKIMHEMAHMWFGDLVTMRWWDDLWLNEGFATYAGILAQSRASRWEEAWTTFASKIKSWAYTQDELPTTHPVSTDAPDVLTAEANFDGITYAKGASVLKQLSAYVGEDAFLAGVRDYFSLHAFGNTDLSDLLASLERASGRDLERWSWLWLQTTGINTLRAEFTLDDQNHYSAFEIIQSATEGGDDDNVLRPHRIAVGVYEREGERLVRVRRIELDIDGERTVVPEMLGVRRPALLLLNDDDLSYCKIRFDDHSLSTVLEGGIAQLDDSLARAVIWTSLWDMTRNAELPAHEFSRVVLANAVKETGVNLMQSLLQQAQFTIDHYIAPDQIGAENALLAAAAFEAAGRAAPGGDHQLAWVQALVVAARSPEHLGLLTRLRAGQTVFDGLTLDDELRWQVIRALSANGVIGTEEIVAEADRDPSAAGQRHAAAAQALQPSAEAKATAWATIFGEHNAANGLQAAVVSGFSHPLHGDLLSPYVEEYFAQVGSLWERRTNELAKRGASGMFPSWPGAISQSTVEEADRFLLDETRPEPLRRLVAEGRDDVQRALRARALDRSAR